MRKVQLFFKSKCLNDKNEKSFNAKYHMLNLLANVVNKWMLVSLKFTNDFSIVITGCH
jgi:hypothetical protein